MSWDADLIDDEHADTTLGSWNYTHNTNAMIAAALEAVGREPGEKHWLIGHMGRSWFHTLDGLSAADGAALLHAVVVELIAHPEKYKPMNPANGWGRYDRLISVLVTMRNASLDAPATAKWSVNG